jgi:N-acetylglutamate synthase-like GNAT family acetyltransferase
MDADRERLISRDLPPEEWPRLRETGATIIMANQIAARTGTVLVEELAGQIVGCALVFTTADGVGHVDACWVHPALRTGRVALRLWRRILRAVRALRPAPVHVYPSTARLAAWLLARRGEPALQVTYAGI